MHRATLTTRCPVHSRAAINFPTCQLPPWNPAWRHMVLNTPFYLGQPPGCVPSWLLVKINPVLAEPRTVPQVRSCEGSHLQGGADRTGDLVLTSEVFHVMHIILSLKLADHEGLALLHSWPPSEEDPACCPACGPDPDSDLCIPESGSCLLWSPIWGFPLPAQQLLEGPSTLALSPRKFGGGSVYFALFILLLIL